MIFVQHINFPNSLQTIGSFAFSRCPLKTIFIPESVQYIGTNPFRECSLNSITVSQDNQNYSVVSKDFCFLYEIHTKTLITYPAGQRNATITIPESIETIGGYAFYQCSSLETITFGNSVQTIGDSAFYWCTKLKEIFFYGYTEPEIENSAFYDVPETLKVYVLTNYTGTTFGKFTVEKILQMPTSKPQHTINKKQSLKFSFILY